MELEEDLVKAFGAQGESEERLRSAIESAWDPFVQHLTVVQEAYTTMGYWYAVAKDRKRRCEDPEDRRDWQRREDILEAWLKGLDRALMVQMHLNRLAGQHQ